MIASLYHGAVGSVWSPEFAALASRGHIVPGHGATLLAIGPRITSQLRLRGTFLPFFRASDRPMAMACLRLFTRPPLPPLPLRSVPCFRLRIALATSRLELRLYLRRPVRRAMSIPPMLETSES